MSHSHHHLDEICPDALSLRAGVQAASVMLAVCAVLIAYQDCLDARALLGAPLYIFVSNASFLFLFAVLFVIFPEDMTLLSCKTFHVAVGALIPNAIFLCFHAWILRCCRFLWAAMLSQPPPLPAEERAHSG